MNYNSLMNKPTINYRELIGDNNVTEVGGITEEQFNTLLNTDLSSYYTKAQIDDLFSRSYVYREKSGNIVTFDCPSTSQSIPEVTVDIEPVQSGSGDPSPTNVRPISGWSAVNAYDTGKNLIGFKDGTGSSGTNRTYTISNNTVSITASLNVVSSQILAGTALSGVLDINLFKAGTYKLSISNQTGFTETIQFVFKYSDNTNITVNDGDTFTLTSDATLVSIAFSTSVSWNTKTLSFNAQIERGETPTTYEAYSGTTTPIQFVVNGENKTIYSGYVEIKNGKVKAVAESECIDLGTLNWSKSSSISNGFYARPLSDYVIGEDIVILCSNYPFIGARTSNYYEEKKLTCYRRTNATSPSEFYIQDTAYSDATAFKTAMNGVQLVYELATPIEYDLADVSISTQDGTNNLWADSGDITVRALDKIIQE